MSPLSYRLLALMPMFALLVWAVVIDLRSRRIPNWLTAALAVSGLAQSFINLGATGHGIAPSRRRRCEAVRGGWRMAGAAGDPGDLHRRDRRCHAAGGASGNRDAKDGGAPAQHRAARGQHRPSAAARPGTRDARGRLVPQRRKAVALRRARHRLDAARAVVP